MYRTTWFREVQRFGQAWMWGLVLIPSLLLVGLFGYAMIQQLILGHPWGDRPMPDSTLMVMGPLCIAFGILLPMLFHSTRLVTEVRPDGLYIRYYPFHRRFHRYGPLDILEAQAVTYRPIREYGGWGIKFGPSGKAYNVTGNRGVRMRLRSGQRLLIGSQRPEELLRAIEHMRGQG